MTIIEAIQKAIEHTNKRIKDAKEVIPFPMYLNGVKEGLLWSLRIIKTIKENVKDE